MYILLCSFNDIGKIEHSKTLVVNKIHASLTCFREMDGEAGKTPAMAV